MNKFLPQFPHLAPSQRLVAQALSFMAAAVLLLTGLTAFKLPASDLPFVQGVWEAVQSLKPYLSAVYAQLPKAYPIIAGAVGVLWTLHILRRPALSPVIPFNAKVDLFCMAVAALLWFSFNEQAKMLFPETAGVSQIGALLASIAVLSFPVAVGTLCLANVETYSPESKKDAIWKKEMEALKEPLSVYSAWFPISFVAVIVTFVILFIQLDRPYTAGIAFSYLGTCIAVLLFADVYLEARKKEATVAKLKDQRQAKRQQSQVQLAALTVRADHREEDSDQ